MEKANSAGTSAPLPRADLEHDVYARLRALAGALMRRERPGHSLQPTALVHEAFIRMVEQGTARDADRVRVLALAGRVMRQVLVDHARTRGARKRQGDLVRVTLSEEITAPQTSDIDIEALDQALARLAGLDPRQAEVVTCRIFGGLTVVEIAEALGVSRSTVESDWRAARAWLSRELRRGVAG